MLQFSQGKTAKTDLPLKVWGASGFRTAQRPIVWSGRGGGNKFFLYKKHQWMPLTNMTTPRNYASALQINPNQALIIGGSDVQTWMMFSSRNYLKSTETVSSSGAEKGKDFSDDIYGHCSFKINAIYGWVIGGYWLYFDATRGLRDDPLTLVETPQGTYAMGIRSEVLKLDCPGDEMPMDPRFGYVATHLPKSSDICSGTTTTSPKTIKNPFNFVSFYF